MRLDQAVQKPAEPNPPLPETKPFFSEKPSLITPEELKRQAELRAAAATPSGIVKPLSDEQLLKFAQEELTARSERAKTYEDIAAEKEKSKEELRKLGLLLPELTEEEATAQVIDDSQVVSRIQGQQQLAQGMAGQQITPGAPGAPGMPSLQKYDSANYMDLIRKALSQEEDAASKSLVATDLLMKQYEDQQALKQKAFDDAKKEALNKINDVNEQTKNFEWDNRSIWDKSSTGQKIALAIGGFLSSLTPKGGEAFRNSIRQTMQRDLDQQKEKYDLLKERNKDFQSFYGDLVKRFGDEKTADLQMMNLKLGLIKNKLATMSQTAQSKIVAAKAIQGMQLVDSEIEKNQADIIAKFASIKGMGQDRYSSIKDDKAKRQLTEQKSATDIASSAIDELISISKTGKIPLTEKSSAFNILEQKLAAEIAKANAGGKPSDAEVADAKKQIPSRYSPYFASSLSALKNRIQQDQKIRERNLGITQPGENIGKLK